MKSFDQDFLQKLERLSLQGTKVMFGGTGGNRRSKAKGSSIEFSDFREYTLGDDYRSIDWNAYARFERLFIKLYMEERETNITIFLDGSASMDEGEPNKGKLAKELAAIFAYIALSNYDRVGMAVINDTILNELPYFSGKPGFTNALSFIDNAAFNGGTSLKNGIMSYRPIQGRRGISIIISDMFSPDGYIEALQYLKYLQQDIIIIHVLSPQELDPPWAGALRLVDSESGKPIEVELTPYTLNLYKNTLNRFINEIQNICSKMEINYIQVDSSVSLDHIIFQQLFKAGIIR